MATLTITIDNQTAEWVRSVAAREQTDETLVAARILERAARQNNGSQDTGEMPPPATDDGPSLEMRQKQIRQIFERNEWR